MRALAVVSLFLSACSSTIPPAPYHCEVPMIADVGSGHQLDCEMLNRNFALAATLFPKRFESVPQRYIDAVRIWDVEHMDCGGSQCWGRTTFGNRLIELDRVTWSLAHEFGHVYRLWKYGDSDPGHVHWDDVDQTGISQRYRDVTYDKYFEWMQ